MAKTKGSGVMGHEKSPTKCDVFSAQKRDIGRIQKQPTNRKGTPDKAFR